MKTQLYFPPLLLIILLLAACLPQRPSPAEEPTDTPESVSPQSIPTEAPTPTPPPRAIPLAYAIAETVPGSFAAYEPYPVEVKPSAQPYAVDLNSVANPDVLLTLSDGQRALLQQNGFVVVPYGAQQIYQIYQAAKDQGQPIFVTTDALLHTYHILYDYTLRFAEIEHFVGDLQGLNEAMLAASLQQYGSASGQVQEAAQRNVAFTAVASVLLDPGVTLPSEVQDLVQAELALIEAHEGFTESPIFGYKEDYSQYVPRGHYTRNETFERYFKAMMWYGRMMFRLKPGDETEEIQKGRMETRQAILVVAALQGASVGDQPALAVWDRIYEPTVFFVGKTDDLNVYDYSQVIKEIYGESLNLGDLADEARLDAFIEKAMTLRPPKIVSSFVTDQEEPEEVTKGFRFMGQRFIPDSYVFQQLVYDQVKLYQGTGQPFTKVDSMAGPIRGFPRGLDVASVLGSGRAEGIIGAEGDAEYDGYPEQLAKLRGEFAALPAEQWVENLYWSWLYSLRPLLEVKGEGYPVFMQNEAWVDKDLSAFLGSWAELRHDTILYAKQSSTIMATSLMPEPEPAKGYVEPQPEVYARLAALCRQMRVGLEDRGLLNPEYTDKLNRMESLLLSLKTMAEKELSGQALTDEEYAQIRNIGDVLEGITTFSVEVSGQITSEADERMAIVADVHTEGNSGQVLEEGVGDAFTIYVVAPVEGQQVVAQGGVFSYYEFKQPMSDRLTDEAWQALEPKPDLPQWTASFIR
jgi:hypothetical protein